MALRHDTHRKKVFSFRGFRGAEHCCKLAFDMIFFSNWINFSTMFCLNARVYTCSTSVTSVTLLTTGAHNMNIYKYKMRIQKYRTEHLPVFIDYLTICM